MNILQRIEQAEAQRHSPDNVVPLDSHPRRTKARWVELKEERGLPVQDSTSRVFRVGPDAA